MEKSAPAEKKLGLWTSTSIVVGNMVGAGVFLLPAALASFGGIGLVGWMVSALGALLIARVFGNMSKLLPGSDGGPYSYTRSGLGDFAGFLVAWGYWISVWFTNATIAISLVGALSTFFPILASNPLVAVITGLSAIWFLTWINTRGIVASGKMQLVTTVLKLIPLVLIAFVGLFFINWNHFSPFNLSGMPAMEAIAASATMTLYAFLGMECATIPAGNVEHPEKTIPRATMMGTGFTTIVYILSTLSVMGIVAQPSLVKSVTPFADAAATIWGQKARYFVGAGVAMAAFGALNGWILVQGQIPMAIARDKLFPAVYEKTNRYGVPAKGILISSILVSLFMVMNFTKGLVEQFRFMLLLSTLTSLVPYLFVTASYVIVVMNKKRPGAAEWFKTLLLAGLSFLFALLAIIGSGQTIVFWGFVLLLAGVPFYVWNIWKKKNANHTVN